MRHNSRAWRRFKHEWPSFGLHVRSSSYGLHVRSSLVLVVPEARRAKRILVGLKLLCILVNTGQRQHKRKRQYYYLLLSLWSVELSSVAKPLPCTPTQVFPILSCWLDLKLGRSCDVASLYEMKMAPFACSACYIMTRVGLSETQMTFSQLLRDRRNSTASFFPWIQPSQAVWTMSMCFRQLNQPKNLKITCMGSPWECRAFCSSSDPTFASGVAAVRPRTVCMSNSASVDIMTAWLFCSEHCRIIRVLVWTLAL